MAMEMRSSTAGSLIPNVNAKVQELYFQFLTDPLNEAQLLLDKKLILQGIDPLSIVPLSRPGLDEDFIFRDFGESTSPTPNSRPATPPPCSPASSPSTSPRRNFHARKRKKSRVKTLLDENIKTSTPKLDDAAQKLPLSPRENFVSERRPKLASLSFEEEKEHLSFETVYGTPQPETEVSLEKKVLQPVITRGGSKSKSPSPDDIVAKLPSTLEPRTLFDEDVNDVPEVVVVVEESQTLTKKPTKKSTAKSSKVAAPPPADVTIADLRLDSEVTPSAGGDFTPKRENNNNNVNRLAPKVPRFYFPRGEPTSGPQLQQKRSLLTKAAEIFKTLENRVANRQHFGEITKCLQLPLYWKSGLFRACGGYRNPFVTLGSLTTTWNRLWDHCGVDDEAAQFLFLLQGDDVGGSGDSSFFMKSSRDYLTEEDFAFLAQDVVESHPGLQFLHDTPGFIPRYVATVISRIFYSVNSSWSGRVTLQELRHDLKVHKRASLLDAVRRLEDSDDINLVTDFFSYEHFYVIYCKFWELDRDHDLKISKAELAGYNDHAISDRMIDRVFSAAVNRSNPSKTGVMTYQEFIWFLLSSEDKRSNKAIEYWFRCMDLDGDGCLSMYELEYFYEEQLRRLESMCIEPLPFEDLLCQMLDLIHPRDDNFITLSDLKAKIHLVHIFFDTFFDLEKYLEHEQRDPFAVAAQKSLGPDGRELTEWERFAMDEYNILVTEGDNAGDDIEDRDDEAYEDDFEVDELTIDDEMKMGMDEGGDDEDDLLRKSIDQLRAAQTHLPV